MMRLLVRLQEAMMNLDLGIPMSSFNSDPLVTTNRALRMLAQPSISSLEEYGPVLRAVLFLESEVS